MQLRERNESLKVLKAVTELHNYHQICLSFYLQIKNIQSIHTQLFMLFRNHTILATYVNLSTRVCTPHDANQYITSKKIHPKEMLKF